MGGLGIMLPSRITKEAYSASIIESRAFKPLAALPRPIIPIHVSSKLLPADGSQARQLQRALVSAASRRTLEALMGQGGELKARLVAHASDHAGDWAFVIPTIPDLRIKDSAVRLRASLMLGRPIFGERSSVCVCGKRVDSLEHHLLLCRHAGGAIRVHDTVKGWVAEQYRRAAIPNAIEVSHVVPNHRIDIFLPGHPDTILDVTVASPYATQDAAHKFVAAHQAERAKRADWLPAVGGCGMAFIPLAFEQSGAVAPEASALIAHVIAQAAPPDWLPLNFSASSYVHFQWQRLAVKMANALATRVVTLGQRALILALGSD
jgi:hypothetical protein